MSLFTRIRQLFTSEPVALSESWAAPPACSHEPEIHELRNQLQAAIVRSGLAEQRLAEVREELGRAIDRSGQLDAIRLEAIAGLEATTFTLRGQIDERDAKITSLRESLSSRVAELEEASARVTYLEVELRRANGGEQSELPIDDGGERPPPAEAKVVSDVRQELAYRLVGIWFEGKSHWVLARGEERIKVPIHDKAFLERLHRGEQQFRAGDTLLAEIHSVTYRLGSAVWADHSVERVVRVIHSDEQMELALPGAVSHA